MTELLPQGVHPVLLFSCPMLCFWVWFSGLSEILIYFCKEVYQHYHQNMIWILSTHKICLIKKFGSHIIQINKYEIKRTVLLLLLSAVNKTIVLFLGGEKRKKRLYTFLELKCSLNQKLTEILFIPFTGLCCRSWWVLRGSNNITELHQLQYYQMSHVLQLQHFYHQIFRFFKK